MNNIDQQQMRAIFKSLLSQSGNSTPQASIVRLEALTDNNKSTYKFTLKQSSSDLATEQRLLDNDAFYAKYARLRLKSEDPSKPGSAVYQSYANAFMFPVASGVVQQDLDGLFNSKLQILIDQQETIKALPMALSRIVPTSQQTVAEGGTTPNRSEADGYDGFIDMHSLVRLGGTASIDINLVLPAYTRAVQYTSGTPRVYISLEFYGFLIPNGSALGQLSVNY